MTQRVSFPLYGLSLSLLLLAAFAGCKPEQLEHPRPVRPKGVMSAKLTPQDREFLEKAAQGNNAEIAVATLGAGRATDPAIQTFANMVVADHTSAQKQLSAIATRRGITIPDSLGEQQRSFDEVVDEQGESFEDRFMQMMVEDHQSAVLLYQAELSGGTDPLLKEYAAAMLPKIQAHLAEAEAIERLSAEPPE